jgi:hypothetical protein
MVSPVHVLPKPLVEVLLRFFVAEIVNKDDPMSVVIKHVSRVSVRLKAPNVTKF